MGWRGTKIPTPNQCLAASPAKTLKILSAFHSHPAHLKHNSPVPPSDTPQGVAARRDRRWGWEGDANLSTSGSGSDLPGGTGERWRRFRTGCRCLSNVRTGPACLCCKTPFRVLRVRSWRSGLPTTGCTDSSSSSGRTRPWGLKRKSGGTQEHAAYAPHRCETARTDRKGNRSHVRCGSPLRRTDRWLRALRQNEASHPRRQMWPNWQGDEPATGHRHPEGQGSDLEHVRPFQRQGPLALPGSASRGKRIAVWPKELNGALRGAIL